MKTIEQSIQRLMKEKTPFNWERDRDEAITDYLTYYQLDLPVQHHFGYIKGRNGQIFVQSFRPANRKAICLVLHGYHDHSGVMSQLIKFLTEQHVHVICYDFEGHGLSDGERAAVLDFAHYVSDLHSVYRTFLSDSDVPIFCVAHSTGAAVVLSYVQRNLNLFQRVALIAPLVRSNLWYASRLAFKMFQPFVQEINRTMKQSTSNKTFNEFRKVDPLQHNKLPLSWIQSMYSWFDRSHDRLTSEQSLLVLQGNKDTTVDWRFNMQFLTERYSNLEIILIDGAKHQLVNEKPVVRELSFQFIKEYLDL